METKELRIGNYVKFYDPINGTNIYEVYNIDDRGNVSLDDKGQLVACTVKDIEPIELTRDILINIGFKRGYNEIYSKTIKDDFNEYNISYQNVSNNKYSFVAYGYKNNVKIKNVMLNDIKYLHELQNAYFLLTNKEMEIEL